jgi:multiple sugar transport system permease protein
MTTTLAEAQQAKIQERPVFKRPQWSPGKVIALLLLVGISILFIIPLLWMISTSLKEAQDLVGIRWIPTRLAWENYVDAFSFGMWPQWTLNTVIITVLSVIGQVLSSSLVAYAFARLRWRARDALFSVVLATMMLPSVVTMIPQFVLFSNLPAFGFMGSKVWVNTFLPLIVPAFTGSAFYIFLLRQFMRGIPQDLTDAARIDGAGELRIWWSIILPMTKPALDFMGPLLYLQSEKWYTLQLGLRQFEAAAGGSPAWNWLMAASLMVMLPVLIVFILFQRYFIEGFNFSGLAGR